MSENKPIISEFAIASLVMGIVSFVNLAQLEKGIVAVIFGILALRRMNQNAFLGGKKLAISGIVLGVISIVLLITLITIFFPQIKEIQQNLMKQK